MNDTHLILSAECFHFLSSLSRLYTQVSIYYPHDIYDCLQPFFRSLFFAALLMIHTIPPTL